jgi:hypothetical protein
MIVEAAPGPATRTISLSTSMTTLVRAEGGAM